MKRHISSQGFSSSSSSSLSSLSTSSEQQQQQHHLDPSSLDPSINLSLKRVKISTSPGELRLMKDFDQLITDYGYTSPSPLIAISPNRKIHVRKDPVDPLRIRIRFPRTIVCLQIPRMYPHVPPSIYRFGMVSSSSSSSSLYIGEDEESIPPPSRDVPWPKIVISDRHPSMFMEPEIDGADSSAAVYRGWSPISRLVDVIVWLEGLVGVEDVEMEDCQEMTGVVGAERWLRANRFDMGYWKDKGGRGCCLSSV